MAARWKSYILICALFFFGVSLSSAQTAPQILPVPIPGGDILPPLFNQFLPGVGPGFDGLNADPHGITNFHGHVAMGYTNGTATDNAGNTYNVVTDIRVYQGEYVGAAGMGGASKSARAHGTFVEI